MGKEGPILKQLANEKDKERVLVKFVENKEDMFKIKNGIIKKNRNKAGIESFNLSTFRVDNDNCDESHFRSLQSKIIDSIEKLKSLEEKDNTPIRIYLANSFALDGKLDYRKNSCRKLADMDLENIDFLFDEGDVSENPLIWQDRINQIQEDTEKYFDYIAFIEMEDFEKFEIKKLN